MISFQKHFLLGRRADLERLARFTDQPLEELEQEASVIAMELQALNPCPLDFASAEVKGEIFSRLKRQFERAKRRSRRHTSLDQARTGTDGEWSLSLGDLLPAEEQSDPLRALLSGEDREARINQFLEVCRKTYSQFTAYLVLLAHFGGEREEAADYLAIAPATLDLRMKRARANLNVQSSLFDGLFFVGLDFWPRRGTRKGSVRVVEVENLVGQLMLFDSNAVEG